MTAATEVMASAHLGRPFSSTLAMNEGSRFWRAIVRRMRDGRNMHSKAMAKIPIIKHALIRLGIPLIPASSTAITKGDVVTLEPPRRRESSEGTMIETRTTETR